MTPPCRFKPKDKNIMNAIELVKQALDTPKLFTIRGSSEDTPFKVQASAADLLLVFLSALEKGAKADEEALAEGEKLSAASKGGTPTALFTAILPPKHRKAKGWDLAEGWSLELALATIESATALTAEERAARLARSRATRKEKVLSDYRTRRENFLKVAPGADEKTIEEVVGKAPEGWNA